MIFSADSSFPHAHFFSKGITVPFTLSLRGLPDHRSDKNKYEQLKKNICDKGKNRKLILQKTKKYSFLLFRYQLTFLLYSTFFAEIFKLELIFDFFTFASAFNVFDKHF